MGVSSVEVVSRLWLLIENGVFTPWVYLAFEADELVGKTYSLNWHQNMRGWGSSEACYPSQVERDGAA